MQNMLAITEIPDHSIRQESYPTLCSYKNTTNQIQIARISNRTPRYFERVVFPGERLLFEALPKAELEIYTGTAVGAMLTEKICCDRLQCAIA